MIHILAFLRTATRWRRALIGGCTVIIVSIIFSNYFILSKLRESTLNDAENHLARRSLALAAQANLSLQSLSLVLTSVSEHVVREGITDASQFRRRMGGSETHQLLKEKITGLPQIEAIGLIDLDGNLINSSQFWPTPKITVADRDYFAAIKDDAALKMFLSTPFQSRSTGTWNIVIVRRLHGPDGEFIGLISGLINLEFFENHWRSVLGKQESDSTVSLNRLDGIVLARFPRTNAIGKRFEGGVQNMLRDSSAIVLRKLGPIDNKMRIESAYVLADYPVFILATETEETALQDWYRTAQMAIIVSLCCVVVALIAAYGLWRWWAEHEHRVRTQAEKIEAERARLTAEAEWQRHKESEIQAARLNAAIGNMSQGLLMFDREERIVVVNEQYIQLYGLSADVVKPGCTLQDLLRHRAETGQLTHAPELYRAEILAGVVEGKTVKHAARTADGREIAVVNRPMPGGGWVVTHEDVTERRESEARIAHMAHHDALTDLPNRALLNERLHEALQRLPNGDSLAVVCLDLDNFKSINDTLGHWIGDELLKAVAVRLRNCGRETDTVARLGGDEFAIIQAALAHPSDAAVLARRIQEAITAPFDLDGHQVFTDASIGISIAPNDGTDLNQLLKNADIALYAAKADGRGVYRFFEAEMDARVKARRALELDLRKALANGEFDLVYQPIVNLERNEVSGLEALLRWHHADRGMIAPQDFIQLAEEAGLITSIGEWVLRRACTEAAKWPDCIKVAVNVSPVQFKNQTLTLAVMNALAESGLPARRLEIEITEAVLLQNDEVTLVALHRLRGLGVRIALDDFGTGYSSLSYLRSFPFDKIKIDRSFIKDLSEKDDAVAIVRAIISLASSLNMTTTVEGIESRAQLDRIRTLGCTEMQGYLFSRPVPAVEILQLFSPSADRARASANAA